MRGGPCSFCRKSGICRDRVTILTGLEVRRAELYGDRVIVSKRGSSAVEPARRCNTAAPKATSLEERLRRILAVHFHPELGTPYWIDRARLLGVDPIREINTVEDLALLGDMTPHDLCARPMVDYVPQVFHRRLDRFIVGQTGGTTGGGTWTIYRDDEFQEAFVRPFALAADHVGFPRAARWLYVGPSGPHIIGKVAAHLARSVGSGDPFSVDFDARWAKRLTEGSFARDRYTQHVVEQAMTVIDSQEIGVLFITPAVLARLARLMTVEQRERVEGVHYAGMAISPQEMERFQLELFPTAVHLSGYGNTLFGCCLEVTTVAGRPLDYYPYGHRLLLEVVDDRGEPVPNGAIGTVRFTRLDESMLLVRMVERDEASRVALPDPAPGGYSLAGVRNPGPRVSAAQPVSLGLY